MAEKLVTKNDLLNKLRAYKTTPDDDVILYKQKIKNALLSNPKVRVRIVRQKWKH